MPTPRTYEECYPEIEKIVENFRSKWTFKASVMRDFEDVKIEILAHIWKKWELFDQNRPLGGWVATIAKHRFSNILRDIYLSTSSPCSRCPCNQGDNACAIYVEQSVECPMYKKWYETRRHSHNVRLPVSIEERHNQVHSQIDSMFDIERAIDNFHPKMKLALTGSEWEIYHRLYILHKDEDTTAKELGFKTSETGRKMGYKRIRQVKTIIFQKARKIVAEEGIDVI